MSRILPIMTAICVLACQTRGIGPLGAVFEGFGLLEVRELPTAEGDSAVPFVQTKDVRPPSKWVAGRLYLLRIPKEFDSEDLALNLLPQRLLSVGAMITRAPQSSADLMSITTGGPLFRIEFEQNGLHGILYNNIAKVDGLSEELLFVELR